MEARYLIMCKTLKVSGFISVGKAQLLKLSNTGLPRQL